MDKYKFSFENSAVGKSFTNIDGTMEVNQAFCDMLGYSKEELVSKTWQNISHPDDIIEIENQLKKLISGNEQKISFEKRYLKKNGEILRAEIHTSLQRDDFGNPLFFNTNIIDITEKRVQEFNIVRLHKELEQIVNVVSHDLRTPLVNISGFSQEIKKTIDKLVAIVDNSDDVDALKKTIEKNSKQINTYLDFIFPSVSKINYLIESLLSVSRIDRKQAQMIEVDMNKIISSIMLVFEYKVKASDIKITIEELPSCIGDEHLINQLFSNLIDNAIKYKSTDKNAEIKFFATKSKKNATYHVQDNGIGIKSEDLENIFELFYRANKTVEGYGLGLSIVKRILNKLNGQISVQSELNKGTTFLVSLPSTLNT
ncbi:MAG TPA: hypothetical protein DDX39_09690 [Bacteroidales bacterium]|nr:MAG: hypothetical protein A2W98_01685 [Bacteroidetes bacterium GWF2_33_38]OFY74352.1 MAG: hypothetical protein A2265_06255 [Bacteroidetes bacterium RIFOXYA12_FULL_33_9]OFY84735.1 MAG: hypothetical protein A2236_04985 [Bacteroidetes bacterium RIFOXYA2_FULL_33_7]HBF88900.1 hypothetical protein [Bacteroidales bacterium]